MLEVKNLTKIYSGKGGVTVRALDDVSVVFPETGMVFLLGKSGSGKSTLLNVIGGLDKPDGGEVIVKGKSSREFSGSDFDSYRNTFIGFVFQEYNILNEFTIEQNIALALQLQSKPNDRKAVAALLEQVDLAGYGKRKPNTLSGGQKQRVAIARALIKEPEIIMADEPTGALDSTTGRQVLETLKKLSEKKLVIVVSHDREFAEQYGDRIIELKDGKIISDVSKVYFTPETLSGDKTAESATAAQENVAMISDNTISIKDGEALTDEEVRRIGEMLRSQKGEVIITADSNDLPGVKRACKINENGDKESFRETGPVEIKQYDGSKTKFIKSHLPLGHAIKMGASGLKSKPFRLIFTILLAVAAFVLFGVASTFMLYDPNYSVSEAMKEANYPSATISKTYNMKVTSYRVDENGNRTYDYDYDNDMVTRFGASEVAARSKSGLDFAGVFNFTDYNYSNNDVADLRLVEGSTYILPSMDASEQDYYVMTGAVGFSDCGVDYMSRCGFELMEGSYPHDKTEVALPAYLAGLFVVKDNGTTGSKTSESDIKSIKDLIGKKIKFSFGAVSYEEFTISGVYNVGEIPEKYQALKATPGSPDRVNDKEKVPLQTSFRDFLTNGLHLVVFVTPDFYDEYAENISTGGMSYNIQQERYKSIYFNNSEINWDIGDISNNEYSVYTDKTLRIYGDKFFRFFDNEGNATAFNAATNGIYLRKNRYNDMINDKKTNQLNHYLNMIINAQRCLPEAMEEYNGDAYQNKLSSKDGGYAAKVAFVKKWVTKVAYRRYVYKAAQELYWSGEEQYTSGSFYAAYHAIDRYISDWSVEEVPTDAMWDTVSAAVSAASIPENKRYAYILEILHDDFWFGEELFPNKDGDEYNSSLNGLREGTLSAGNYAALKNKIDTFMAGKGLSTATATLFALSDTALDFTVDEMTVYYVDGNNVKGSLPVLGYFTDGSDWGADYFVSETFMKGHALYAPYNSEYQISVWETDYVIPVDAKYNYLVSPTDNSSAQISAILSTEKGSEIAIVSSVYQELQMFLELIEELEKIFLYVGLGVGLLAAFFLLNFISVSISAKKKDIGILRAVGARGSDVFKIFYAEAFIIAFICFVLASVGSYILCFFLNRTMVEVVSMKLLHFGPINIGLVFGISLFVSIIATFFPVFFAARKSPVEAIRAL